jgi:hypothetical protein
VPSKSRPDPASWQGKPRDSPHGRNRARAPVPGLKVSAPQVSLRPTNKKRGRPMRDISDIIDWKVDAAIASALGFLR